MKKIVMVAIVAAIMSLSNSAKAQTYSLGDNVVNLTIGFGSGIYTGSYYTVYPGVAVSFEHCFWDDLINGDFSVGIGGYLGISGSKYESTWLGAPYSYSYTTTIFAGRGTFHWTGVENLDTYAGVDMGGRVVNYSESGVFPPNSSSPYEGGSYFSSFVGARYYFSDSFCVVGELGSGVTYVNFGIGFNF